jgi:hypothetical protein
MGHHKSQNPGEIKTIHQRRTCGSDRRRQGKSRHEIVESAFVSLGYQESW